MKGLAKAGPSAAGPAVLGRGLVRWLRWHLGISLVLMAAGAAARRANLSDAGLGLLLAGPPGAVVILVIRFVREGRLRDALVGGAFLGILAAGLWVGVART